MKAFLIGLALAIVLATATGVALNAYQVGSDTFNSSKDVRL